MVIKDRTINDDSPCFIVAELSANHNHKFQVAVDTIKAAKEAGVDAIKFQTYTADTMTIDSRKGPFMIEQGLWKGSYLHELYQQAYTPWEWHPELMRIAGEEGLLCFSTPFDHSSVDFLEELKVPAYKIASFEIRDLPLIEYVASKGKPIILSTGIATLSDIEAAVKVCREANNNDLALLKCTSAYPAPFEEANIKTISHLKELFGTVVGLSDHTLGVSVPILSIAFGTKIIEKHLILDRDIGGPDAKFSLEPSEFKQLVQSVREAELALGEVRYDLSEKVMQNRIFGRSLFVVEDVEANDVFTSKNVRSIRPANGLHPKFYNEILGKKARVKIDKGTPLDWGLIC